MQMAEMDEKVRKAQEERASVHVTLKAAKEAHVSAMLALGVPRKLALGLVTAKTLNGKVTGSQTGTLLAACIAMDDFNARTAALNKAKKDRVRSETQHKKSVNTWEKASEQTDLALAQLQSVQQQLQKAEQLQKVPVD